MLAIYSNEILLSKAEVHAACFSVLQSLCGLIMALVIKIPSPKVVLQIKRNAVLCARVLGNDVHQFNTALIYDAFRGMGEFFRKKVATDIKGKWREYLKQDNFQQVIVTKSTCLKNLELCGLQKRCDEFLKTADSRGNISLPFTSIVQHGCHEIHEMIEAMFHFEWHLNIPEWGNLVRDDTWEALSELSTVLNELIDRTDDLQISQAVITAANSSYLSSACDVIAAVLTQQIESWESRTRISNQTPKQQTKAPRATAATTKKKFESTSTRAQDMVCELMVKKIDDLIGSFFFLNWTATEVNSQVDPCMSDLINYLQASFTQLDALMQFANACNVTQLRECFLPLTQMVDLIVSNDIEHLDTSIRNGGKYTHVMPDQVIAVLEKYKEVAATGASKFFKAKKAPAEGGLKKAVIDSVVKQLRMMNPHAK
ncbi:exocyst complex component [Thraustotheca clavata]|uniref:Exocyst complex component n=1 Tax=Thraustotheca clavata TaxID=74557 RepID=A0A1V9YTB1_9STRA|nr:exocyst complex component [Thraustotheca clavata]